MQNAVAGRRVLLLDYRGRSRTEVTRRAVEPLALVYYAENWHLIAYCRLRQDLRDFRTDRIEGLELQKEQFTGHTEFSLRQYLESVMHEGEFEMAQVRFAPEAIERVRRERYWGLVEEVAVEDGIQVTLLDHCLERLASWVLSFGAQAEAIHPARFRDLVAKDAQRLAALYLSIRQSAPGHRAEAVRRKAAALR